MSFECHEQCKSFIAQAFIQLLNYYSIMTEKIMDMHKLICISVINKIIHLKCKILKNVCRPPIKDIEKLHKPVFENH